jgi:hypothetical protein
MYGDHGWLSDCEDSGWSARFVARPLRHALVGCAGWGAGARGADCGPVVRAGEGGQGDDLLAAVCRVPALGGDRG